VRQFGSKQHAVRACAFVLFFLFLVAAPAGAWANENLAIGELPGIGSQTNGDYIATHAADGAAEKIAEAKDSNGHYRLEWFWHFEVAPGNSYSLQITAQATNTRHGMDHYEIAVSDGSGGWIPLGQVTATTMTSYDWSFPAGDFGGTRTIRATDSNQGDDPRRANQLWIDHLAIVSEGPTPEPLGAPDNLEASSPAEGTISLSWRDNATGETGFQIERKVGNQTAFEFLLNLPPDSIGYQDNDITANVLHSYRIAAFDAEGLSGYSNEANITPGGGGTGTGSGPMTDKVITGYFPSWGIYNARKYWVRHIPFDRVTHINYAFANIDPATSEVVIGDSFAEETNRKDPETDDGLPAGNLYQLTHYRDFGHEGPAYPHLKIIISVGGWTWSENFSDAAATPESRWRFADSLRNFVATYNLDGADIDWEYPTGDPNNCGEEDNVCRPEDPINHALLIMASRLMLGEDKELTVALPASPEAMAKILPPLLDNERILQDQTTLEIMRNPDGPEFFELADGSPTALDALDRIHVMIYDLVGASWEDTTRHHAPLYGYYNDPAIGDPVKEHFTKLNGHFAIQAYRFVHDDYSSFNPDNPDLTSSRYVGNIPAEKLSFGLPLYGRAFKSVDVGSHDTYEGLFQFTDSSARRRTPKGTWDGGQWGNSGVFGYWDILLNHGGDMNAPDSQVTHAESDWGGAFGLRPYGPYSFDGDLWIGFDDCEALADKVDYVETQGLGGVMFWDFPGDLSQAQVDQGVSGAAEAYPEKSLVHNLAELMEGMGCP
jgi:chitinase